MNTHKLAQIIPLLLVALPVAAQQVNTENKDQKKAQRLDRLEITGSSIKRVQDEAALPVQIISREDIQREGITSAEQLIARITANGTGADNLASNVGVQQGNTDRNNNGNSSANLRGLGASSTLVLLNGRRVSTHGAKGNAVNLNSIPLGAVERVEVLKDGASAIYGTDAIGGVINFILRKDFRGVEITGFLDVTEDGGGNIYRTSIVAGRGDLAEDKYNIMASLTYDENEVLRPQQRRFVNGFQPDRGLSPDTTGTPFATQTGGAGTAIGATYRLPTTGTQSYNRANLLSFQGNCNVIPQMTQYQNALWNSPGFRFACAYDYGGQEILIQPVQRTNFVSRGVLQLNADHSIFAEIVASRSEAQKQFEQSQVTTSIAAGNAYPVNGPYYQNLRAYIPTFDPTRPIAYRWRCVACGRRTIDTQSDSYRVLLGADGLLANWDYKIGLSTAGDVARSVLGEGYVRNNLFNPALASGLINPWLLPGQTQTAEAQTLIAAASAAGRKLFDGRTRLLQFDGSISGEIVNLPGGALSAAFGFDVRKESYEFGNRNNTADPIRDAPFDAEFPRVSRNITAVYGEVAIPVIKSFETTVAVRHDQYSLFGGTTNPKVAFKWAAADEVLVRGSYNTGFRAPSFFQLYGAQGESPVPGNIADPQLCPLNPTDLSVCAIRPPARSGGNKSLTPEKSKQWTIGLVIQPTNGIQANIDMWQIKRTDRIYELTPQQVIANYTTFPENLVRGSDGRLDGPGGFIRAGFVNADGDVTQGVDMGVHLNGKFDASQWAAGIDGTYINSFRSRIFITQAYTEYAGQWNSRDLFPRWKHQAFFTYATGPWGASVSQSYTAGYKDEVPAGVVPPGFNPRVKPYMYYNVSASFKGFAGFTVNFGIKNLLNTDPPFTAHNVDFAAGAGWDPRVADPRGRAYTASMTYRF